jgi:hypothetical protein
MINNHQQNVNAVHTTAATAMVKYMKYNVHETNMHYLSCLTN